MIKNERQYRITKAQAAKFEAALRGINERATQENVNSILVRAEEAALRSQLDDLTTQLAEYDTLRSGAVTHLSADAFGDLPNTLIKARIAAGMSQKDLAQLLGLKEQQIQKYEATNYSSASFDRLNSVVRVLGLTIREEVILTKNRIT